MRHTLTVILLVLAVVLGAYVGTFTFWWVRSPSRTMAISGKQVHVVEFQFNSVSTRTEVLWMPAFWFVEHVGGYTREGYIAMFENSRIVYSK